MSDCRSTQSALDVMGGDAGVCDKELMSDCRSTQSAVDVMGGAIKS